MEDLQENMRRIRLPKLEDLLGGRQNKQSGSPSLVIVGLGNPGPEYARTRHNAGFWLIDRLAKEYSIALSRRHRTAIIGEGEIEGYRIVLVKPRTFVNRSGETIRYLMARYGISSENLLIAYDEIALPPGKLRMRSKGSAGGHNGIKSIIEAVGGQDFPRLRVGVGQPTPGDDQIGHVLGTLLPDEQKAVDEALDRSVQAVSSLLTDGIDVTMNRFN